MYPPETLVKTNTKNQIIRSFEKEDDEGNI